MKKIGYVVFVVSAVFTSMNFSYCGKKERELREKLGAIGGDLPEGISKRLNNRRDSDRNHKGAYRKYRCQQLREQLDDKKCSF